MRLPVRNVFAPLLFATFTLVAALEATHAFVGHQHGYVSRRSLTAADGELLGWFDLFLRQAASWWIFGVFALAAIAFARRRPVRPDAWLRTLLPHIVVSLIFPIAFIVATTLVRYYVFLSPQAEITFRTFLLNRLLLYYATYLLYYWAIIGACSAFRYHALLRERAISEARLDRDLNESRMRALQAQLQPHLLFNTLNAISGYALERNHDAVVTMLSLLRTVLRSVLRHQPARSISLAEELEVVRAYLELHRLRLGARLVIEYDIEAAVLNASVPPLLLQPLVENAVKHGIAAASAGRIRISAAGTDGSVTVEIADDGPGFAPLPSRRSGLGITATEQRIALFYGPQAQLEAATSAEGGALVRVVFPHVLAAGDAATLPA